MMGRRERGQGQFFYGITQTIPSFSVEREVSLRISERQSGSGSRRMTAAAAHSPSATATEASGSLSF